MKKSSAWILPLLTLAALVVGWIVLPKSKKFPILVRLRFLLAGYPQSLADKWLQLSRLETGNYSSRLFLENLNPWGMKVPRKRDFNGVQDPKWEPPANGPFLKYPSLYAAADDLIKWMKEFQLNPGEWNPGTLEAFAVDLKKRGYFQEPFEEYFNGLKQA